MPKAIDDFVQSRLSDQDFYPDKEETERRSLAFALANKLQNEGHLQGSIEPLVFYLLNAPTEFNFQASEGGDILVFKNAILAREETNKNNDEITESGIKELAASIGGRAIDIEHDRKQNAGVFTEGRPIFLEGHWACSVDGFLWADRYPDEVSGVQSGTHQLSIEADAQTAECSICHSKFGKRDQYCNHLSARRTSGARRTLYGLKSKGGAITRHAAGTDTHFDPNHIYFVASHAEPEAEAKTEAPMKCPHCEAENTAEAKVCSKCNKGMEASVIAKELKAALTQLESATTQSQALKTESDQAKTDLVAEREKTAMLTANLRRNALASVWDDAEWEKNKPAVMQMTDEAFTLMASTVQKAAKTEPDQSGGVRIPQNPAEKGKEKVSITL